LTSHNNNDDDDVILNIAIDKPSCEDNNVICIPGKNLNVEKKEGL
jgi:hypothetical protein